MKRHDEHLYWSAFSRDTEAVGVCDKELTHTVMEAEKAHNLLSAGWSPREAGGVIQSKSKGLSTREADDIDSSPGPEA